VRAQEAIEGAERELAAIERLLGERSSTSCQCVRLSLDPLAEALADDPVLLVLDNFGHLLDASPRRGRDAHTCPALAVIATSRIPLHLAWEQELPGRHCCRPQHDEDATRPRR
jgi:predicted ATPase